MCLASSAFYKFDIDTPKNVKIGDKAAIKFISRGKNVTWFSFFRLIVSVEDQMSGEKKKIKLTGNGSASLSCPIDTTHCGAKSYSVDRFRIYDLFGLFFVSRFTKSKTEVVVRPVPHVPAIMPELNGFKARHLRKSNSSYSEIYDVRDYIIGDPIKNIHWKASAKKDMLLVKEPQEEVSGHARVFLAMSRDRDRLDRKMGELLFTSDYFLNKDIPHKIRILPPMRREVAFDIQSPRDLETAMLRILHMKIPEENDA